MRILHVNPFFYPYIGGTENYIYDLSTRLVKRGHDVTVLTAKLKGTKEEENVDGIRVVRVPSLVLSWLPPPLPPPYAIAPAAAQKCAELARRNDVIHLHNRFFISFASAALRARKNAKKPLVLTVHNSKPRGISPVTDFGGALFEHLYGKHVIRNADHVIGNSSYSLDVTAPFVPPSRKEVIYNGIDLRRYRRVKSGVKKKLGCRFLSATTCRLIKQKGLQYLVDALPLVKTPGFHALVVGGGPLRRSLEARARRLQVADKITFTGKIPHENLLQVLSAADCFVLPSLYEPFGIAVCEAMRVGMPVATSSVGGLPEVVGDAGLLFKPKNPEEIANAIDRLASDRQLCHKLGHAGLERAKHEFDWNKIAPKVEAAYERLLSGERIPGRLAHPEDVERIRRTLSESGGR
ncbi:glycosyltransferase family 4 protein [archaeon]|nr:glycosyltransferase family 4 protein [archaeon]